MLSGAVRRLGRTALYGRWLMSAAREYAARRNRSSQLAKSHRAEFYEHVWREAAELLGAETSAVGREVIEITHGDRRTRVLGNLTAADDPVTLRLANDKTMVHRMLAAHGLPVPDHVEYTLRSLDDAERFMAHTQVACVVKAARSTGAGQGVTAGIRTRHQLTSASLHAAVYSKELLIEREVTGSVYRLLVADGLLLDIVVRHRPTVVGDGRSTVQQLVALENDQRLRQGHRAQALMHVDQDMKIALARLSMSLRSVPAEGVAVAVKSVTNDNAPRDNEVAAAADCGPLVDAARQAARTVGLRLAGVDIITSDPSQPLQSTGGVILEVNGSPGFHYHYYRRGEGAAVAVPILAMLLGIGGPGGTPWNSVMPAASP